MNRRDVIRISEALARISGLNEESVGPDYEDMILANQERWD